MTMPEVSCKAVAVQNSSEWPCSMCPFPQRRLVGVRTSYIYFSLIFPGHPEFWTTLQIPIWDPPLDAPCYNPTSEPPYLGRLGQQTVESEGFGVRRAGCRS